MTSATDAEILIAPGCPHCQAMLAHLLPLAKDAVIGRLEVVNVAAHPERAEALGVRSVPWTRIGIFEFDGAVTGAVLRRYAADGESVENLAGYFVELLKTGRRARVEDLARERPQRLEALLHILDDPAVTMAVRIGIGAVLEELAGSGVTEVLIPGLVRLTHSEDRLTRADACHFLALIGGETVVPPLTACLDDPDADVREIAAEALGEVKAAAERASR